MFSAHALKKAGTALIMDKKTPSINGETVSKIKTISVVNKQSGAKKSLNDLGCSLNKNKKLSTRNYKKNG